MAKGDNVIRPAKFRQGVQAIEVAGTRLHPPKGRGCSVDVDRCVGLDEDGFAVVDGSVGQEFFFCRRHALAAEALVTFAGYRGNVVPHLLAMIDSSPGEPLAEERKMIDAHAARARGPRWKWLARFRWVRS